MYAFRPAFRISDFGSLRILVSILPIILIAALDVRLIALVSAGCCLVQTFYSYPMLLVFLWPVSILLRVFYPDVMLQAGPFWLTPMDPVYFFTLTHLGLCALLERQNIARVIKQNKALFSFVLMIGVYILVFIPVYGHSAIGEARKYYFAFLFPPLAFISIKQPADIHRLLSLTLAVAGCIAVAAFSSAVLQGSIVRAVNAQAALIAALVALSVVIHRFYGMKIIHPLWDRIILIAVCAVAVGAGHRTVWLAILAGAGIILALYYRRSALFTKILALMIASVFVGSVAMAVFPEMQAQLSNKLSGILNPSADRNASWRMEGWRQQLTSLTGSEALLGQGLGGYYTWKEGMQTVTASPHNSYVQLTLKFGVLGLLMYFLLVLSFVRKALSIRRKLASSETKGYLDMGFVNFGAGHAYMTGYGFDPIILLFFGVALAAMTIATESAPAI